MTSSPWLARLLFPCLLAVAPACGGDDDADDAALVDATGGSVDGAAGPFDAPPADATPVDGGGAVRALLPGRWEGVGIEDSGGYRAVEPGTFLVFTQTHAGFGCDALGSPWSLSGGDTIIHLDFGKGSGVDWFLVALDSAELRFGEGGDLFYYERRTDCP